MSKLLDPSGQPVSNEDDVNSMLASLMPVLSQIFISFPSKEIMEEGQMLYERSVLSGLTLDDASQSNHPLMLLLGVVGAVERLQKEIFNAGPLSVPVKKDSK